MSGSLRDQLSEAFTEVEAQQETPAEVVQEAPAEETPAPAVSESAEQKAGRTAGRARDEHGRLLPGKAERPQTPAAPASPDTSKTPTQAQATVAAEPPKPKVNRPSSWKKDYWEHFDKIAAENPALAEYINQRESDYAKGVSTYKAEAEHAKPILEAISPFMATLQAHNVQPAQWINQLGSAHQTLVYGNPQQKLAMFAQMARDYQVDLGQMFVKGQDGQIYFNPQLQQAAPRQQQQQHDVRKLVQDALSEERARSEVERMRSDTKKYPHFETVRATMVGLLQSGLATDYDEAYHAAIRHPRHSDIFEAMQQQQRQQEAEQAAEEKRRVAEAARRNAISPRSATPTAAASANGKKGLRGELEAAFEQHSTGRV